MKKENRFVVSLAAMGGMAGFWTIAVLMAIAVPAYDSYILSLEEKRQLDLLQKATDVLFWSNSNLVLVSFALVLSVAAVALLLRMLNPHIGRDTFRRPGPFFRFATAFLLAFAVIPVVVALLKEAFSIRSGVMNILDIGFGRLTGTEAASSILFHVFLSYGLQFGCIWVLLGEQGWLGDLSSWKRDLRENGRMWRRTFAQGAAVGIGTAVTLVVQSWFFSTFFVLVSEVLDRSGETSFIGFLYLLAVMVVMMSVLGWIFGGLTIALAPVERASGSWRQKIRMPATVFALMAAVMLAIYASASVRYDLNKKDLAEAVGIPEASSRSMTLIVTESGKDRKTARAVAWPLQITVHGMVNQSTVEVTPETLEKITAYLGEHPRGSVFRYVAREALIKGYNALAEMDTSLDLQHAYSEEMLLPRVMLIKRLSVLPITMKNRDYLDSFADDRRWYVGGRYALKLAEAFIHQGRLAEAKKWVQQAEEKGSGAPHAADIEKAVIPSGPVLTNGRVSGTVLLNGAALTAAKVLLLSDSGRALVEDNASAPASTESILNAMAIRLVDVRVPDGHGHFSFDRLGAGSYFLALMVNSEKGPVLEKVRMKNNPGVFPLDLERPRADLGRIEVAVR